MARNPSSDGPDAFSEAPTGRPPRVLVADDNLEMRRLLATALRRDGCEVQEAASGGAALTWLAKAMAVERLPDLIVSDVRMPGVSGLEILSGLRARGWTTPFILITAFGDAEVHRAGQRLGATDVVDKPFDLSFFRRLVRRRLGSRAEAHRGELR